MDTPKRISLQANADRLRAELKTFERNYSAEHGAKPGKEEIKADVEISAKYKEYNKVRDVLSGKLGIDALENGSPKRKREAGPRSDRKRRQVEPQATPRAHRTQSSNIIVGMIDQEHGEEEEQIELTAIGPTPQRDGTIMGLFDMMSEAGSGRHQTPGKIKTPSSQRRRTELLPSLAEDDTADVTATPEQKRSGQRGDLLQVLSSATPATARPKHSRTPVSEGKKFMLSQFFATPSTVRYGQILPTQTPKKDSELPAKTQLKDHVLGLTPGSQRIFDRDKDKTPRYLKRSQSFKDKLLSASGSSAPPSKRNNLDAPASPISIRIGPSLGRARGRFQPKPLSQIAAEMRQREQEQRNIEGDDEDGMDALREMEDAELNSQEPVEDVQEQAPRVYKKKTTQKRQVRRVIMRPQPKLKTSHEQASRAAGDEDEEEEEVVEGTQLQVPPGGVALDEDEWSDDDLFEALNADVQNDDAHDFDDDYEKAASRKKPKTDKKDDSATMMPLGKLSKRKKPSAEDEDNQTTKPRMYDPNAISHMNFKTLKIKNKNSKGKFRGGRGGKFGRRR